MGKLNKLLKKLFLSKKNQSKQKNIIDQDKSPNQTIQDLYHQLKDTLPEKEAKDLVAQILKEEKELHVLNPSTNISVDTKENKAQQIVNAVDEIAKQNIPKDDKTTLMKVLKEIDKTLTDEAAFEKIRELKKAKCPSCQSTKIRRRGVHPLNPYCHTYVCDLCGYNFDDLSGSGLSSYVRSMRRWVLCWYYLGFDVDPETLAEVMGVPVEVIEKMIDTMHLILPLDHHSRNMHYKLDSEQFLNKEEDRRVHQRRLNMGSSTKT